MKSCSWLDSNRMRDGSIEKAKRKTFNKDFGRVEYMHKRWITTRQKPQRCFACSSVCVCVGCSCCSFLTIIRTEKAFWTAAAVAAAAREAWLQVPCDPRGKKKLRRSSSVPYWCAAATLIDTTKKLLVFIHMNYFSCCHINSNCQTWIDFYKICLLSTLLTTLKEVT